MSNLLKFLAFSLLLACMSSCGEDDESSSSGCEGVLESGATMELNGDVFNLSVAQLLLSEGFDGDVYQFQIAGISSDCNEVRTVSFAAEITTDSDFDGTYNIVDFFDAGLNDVFQVNVVNSTLQPAAQSSVAVNSGTLEVTKNASRNYTVSINGTQVGGDAISVDFRSEF